MYRNIAEEHGAIAIQHRRIVLQHRTQKRLRGGGGGQQVQQRQQQRNHLEHGEPDLDNDYNQTVVFVAAVVI